jgi:hypothetical protein
MFEEISIIIKNEKEKNIIVRECKKLGKLM